MRRKPGALIPLELAICRAAAELRRRGTREFHGYEIARHLGDATDARLLTAYGTLYRALGRLAEMGLLSSRREDPRVAARENRPLRRLYSLTATGLAAVSDARRDDAAAMPARPWRRRVVPA
jgi:DNA-binding PadR family transcriptional regulator